MCSSKNNFWCGENWSKLENDGSIRQTIQYMGHILISHKFSHCEPLWVGSKLCDISYTAVWMSISIGVLQSAYIWRDSKWVITNIYFKNNEKLNLLHVSPLSGPLNDWHNKCLVLLFHSFLITNVLLQALHSLNSAPSSYSLSGNGSCLGTTPWKTGRKNGFNNSTTQYILCNLH